MHIPLLAHRSYSSGTAEVATKTFNSWSNAALDAPNEDQCGLCDVNAPIYDQRWPLDTPNDKQCAPNEPVFASSEASATVRIGITRTIPLSAHLEYAPCSTNSCLPYSSAQTLEQAVGVPDDAAKRFGHSAPVDAAAAERAGLRVEENEGVACPPWWLPPFMANHGQAHSGNQVAHVDANDGKPHRVFMSDQSAEQPTPADSPSHAPLSSESSNPVRSLSSIAKARDTTDWWTSSTLLCAFVFVLSVYAFTGKVPFLLRAASTLLYALLLHPAPPGAAPPPPAPCPLLPAPRAAPAPST